MTVIVIAGILLNIELAYTLYPIFILSIWSGRDPGKVQSIFKRISFTRAVTDIASLVKIGSFVKYI